jgi:uncharacterized membrane protein
MASDRTYPKDWVGLLPDESARWVQQGLINAEQRTGILKLYPDRTAEGRDRTTLFVTILGAILLGAGVILFFAANWPKIAAPVKVGALLSAVLACYGAGYYLQFKRTDYPRLGQSLIFLGGLLYGASVWLIAQIFHLDSHYPNGFLFWGAGLLPLVYVVESLPLLGLASVLLTIWTVMEQSQFAHINLLYPILLLGAIMPMARRSKSLLIEASVLVGLFFWYTVSSTVSAAQGQEPFIVARGLLLYGSALWISGLAGLGDERPYLSVGSVATLLGLYLLTFHSWKAAGAATTGPAFVLSGTVFLLVAALVASYFYIRRGGRPQFLAVLLLPVVVALTFHLPVEVLRLVIANLLLLAGTIGLITLGVQRHSQLLVNLGLFAFAVHVITRYFDLFFSAMDKSLFFVLGGVLLLGGGWLLERNRRRWMSGWGGDDHAS